MGETLREPQGIDKAGLGWRACEDNGKESNKEIFHCSNILIRNSV
jgi:hypothetical protein